MSTNDHFEIEVYSHGSHVDAKVNRRYLGRFNDEASAWARVVEVREGHEHPMWDGESCPDDLCALRRAGGRSL